VSNVPVGQADFGAGIYRGREAPPNAAFDLLNCLIDDEGQPRRRGGSAFLSTSNAGATLVGLADLILTPGIRTLLWGAADGQFWALDDAGAPVSIITGVSGVEQTAMQPRALSRVATVGPWAFLRGGTAEPPAGLTHQVTVYAGSRKGSNYTTGTIAVTAGSRIVTGTGTAWLANADAGMILDVTDFGAFAGVVASVNSNTQLTLKDPYPSITDASSNYVLRPVARIVPLAPTGIAIAAVASAAQRLLVAIGHRMYFSNPGFPPPLPFTEDMNGNVIDFHELPVSAQAIGLEGVGDSALMFTTAGVWAISNLAYDPLDDAGNDQHTVRQINELVLWGDPGIAKWRGAVVAPCVDDVWLLPPDDAPIPIGEGIKPLYLSYVKAGYAPGMASVHRGTYFLPIVSGTTWIDTLVCRLDRDGFPWVRWSGHGAGIAYAQRIGATTRSPKLFSVASQRVTDLTDAWSPSAANASDADGTTHAIDIITRDLSTPGRGKGSVSRRVRVRYEAVAAATPAFTMSYARGPEDAAFTSLGSAIRGGAASDGLDESVWPVGKQAPAIRFRLQSSSALSSFTLRSIAAEYTPVG
jgi:hypothetical protein